MPAMDYKVISAERSEAYAGKLGRRVQQTLIAEMDGKRYEIKLGRTHTAINRSTKTYAAGDTISVGDFDWGTQITEAK